MAITKMSEYGNVRYKAFPSESTEKYADKDRNYYLDFMKAMMYSYVSKNGSSCIKYNSAHLKKLDSYFKGTQGNTLVKEKLLRKGSDGRFYGKMGKVFQTYDLLPEMMDVIKAINMRQNYSVSTIAVDDISAKARTLEAAMYKFVVDDRTRKLYKMMEFKPSIVLTPEEISQYTDADIDSLVESGGIQLEREMAAKAACDVAMLNSQYKEIENQCTEDLLKWAMAAVRTYTDHSDNSVKIRAVDLPNAIIPDSRYNDFRDITRFGEVRMIKLIELKERCPGLTYEQYKDIIDMSKTIQYNAEFAQFFSDPDNINKFYRGTDSCMDEVLVPIMEAQWLANDVEYNLVYKTSNGNEAEKKVDRNYKLDGKQKSKGDRIERKNFIKRYDCMWLIGTDILLEYGVAKGNIYYGKKGKKTPSLDISVIKTGQKSLTERCISFVEDINLAVVKLRSAIATMPPAPQIVIYQHALQNVKMGGKLQTSADLVRGLIEEGILVANGQDEKGNFILQNGGKAVETLSLNVTEQIVTFSNEIQQKINMIRQVLGLPEGLDGTSGNPYQGLGKQQMAAAASSNALFPTLSRIQPLFEKMCLNIVKQYQALCNDKDISIEDISLSERAAKIFKLTKDFTEHEFMIKILYAPNEDEKQFILQKITELNGLYIQSQGATGLNTSEFLMIYRLIKADRIEEAMRQLARSEKINRIVQTKLEEARIMANSQVQQESAINAANQARETIAAKGEEDRKKVSLEKGLDSLNSTIDSMVDSYKVDNKPIPRDVVYEAINEALQRIMPILQQDAQQAAILGAEEAQAAVMQEEQLM